MPRDLTHVIIADEIRTDLSKDAARVTKENQAAFHMGVISYDSFLYGSSPKTSTTLHGGLGHDTRDVMIKMMDDIRAEKSPEKKDLKKAFLYGFLTHTAVDSSFHPFVYSVSGSQLRENNTSETGVLMAKARHRYVETWLDMHFIEKKGYVFDNFRPLRKIAADVKMRKTAGNFLCDAIEAAYGAKDGVRKDFQRGLITQLFVGKITRNQTLGKALRRLDTFFEGRLGTAVSGFYQKDRLMPPSLTDFTAFKHPVTGETVKKTLNDLESDAVLKGRGLIAAAEKYLENGNKREFFKAVPNVNLDTGMENTRLADVRHVEPADLSVLRGEKMKKFMQKTPLRFMVSGAEAQKGGASVNKNGNTVKTAEILKRKLRREY